MSESTKLSRRNFLKASAVTAVAALVQACAQPTATPKPAAATAAPTKPAAAAATAAPTAKPAEPTKPAAAAAPTTFQEAPALADLVKAGKLPPVKDRVSEEPLVIKPVEEVGKYGGEWRNILVGVGDNTLTSRMTYMNLIRWNITGTEQIPHVAKSWEVSPDGKAFTFKLRKGMKWSDGSPFGAADIDFWFNDLVSNTDFSPTFPANLTVGGEKCKVEKIDDQTIRFSFAKTYGLFLTFAASANWYDMFYTSAQYLKQFHGKYADATKLAAMVAEKKFTHWRELLGDRRNVITNPDAPVIYPWKMTVVQPVVPMVAERNPYCWKVDSAGNQLPYLDKIVFDVVENADLANMKMIAGEVGSQLRQVQFKNYPLFQQNKDKGDYRIIQWARGYITDMVIAPNVMHKDPEMAQILGDKRFRWALSMAMNRDEIIQGPYLGMTEANQVSPLPTSAFYWQDQAKNRLKYDLDGANKLLDEMGLTKKDADGFRLKPSGKRLSIVFEHCGLFGTWGDVGELLASHWKKAGIELLIKLEARDLFYSRKLENVHDMGPWTGSAEFMPLIDPRWFLPLTEESVHATPAGVWYNTGGKSGLEATGDLRKVQQLYDQIKDTADLDQQKKLFRQILELNMENMWVIGICTAPPELVITKNKFRNVPDKAVSDWHLLTPGATMPEQYFWKV
jgi:peptide/nickel transport system substrate-binding protein